MRKIKKPKLDEWHLLHFNSDKYPPGHLCMFSISIDSEGNEIINKVRLQSPMLIKSINKDISSTKHINADAAFTFYKLTPSELKLLEPICKKEIIN